MTLRLLNRSLQTALDIALLSVAYWLAFLFRFEFSLPSPWLGVLLATWPYVVILYYFGLVVCGVPKMSWRYVSIGDVGRVLLAVAASTAVLVVRRLVWPHLTEDPVVIPNGVIAMHCVLAFLGLVGVRVNRSQVLVAIACC